MKKILAISVWLLLLGFSTWYCTKDDFSTSDVIAEEAMNADRVGFYPNPDLPNPEIREYILYVGFKERAGIVKASKDKSTVFIHFQADPGWLMAANYLEIGTPLYFENMEAPDPLRFTYRVEHEGKGVSEYAFAIPVKDLERLHPVPGRDPFEVAFAAVAALRHFPDGADVERMAWAGDRRFKGSKYAQFFSMEVQPQKPDPVAVCEVELKTYYWEEWAAEPEGQPPVSYLYEGFDKLFGPGGVFGPEYFTIGCVGHFKEFITPEMVTAYLRGDYTVDWQKYPFPIFEADDLSGAVTTLALNVYFDWGFPDFAPSSYMLKDMVVVNTYTRFDGWTVAEVLAAANEVMGGCNEAYTKAEMHALVTLINKNYHNPAFHEEHLNCPETKLEKLETIRAEKE